MACLAGKSQCKRERKISFQKKLNFLYVFLQTDLIQEHLPLLQYSTPWTQPGLLLNKPALAIPVQYTQFYDENTIKPFGLDGTVKPGEEEGDLLTFLPNE